MLRDDHRCAFHGPHLNYRECGILECARMLSHLPLLSAAVLSYAGSLCLHWLIIIVVAIVVVITINAFFMRCVERIRDSNKEAYVMPRPVRV